MIKDFDGRNHQKQLLDKQEQSDFFVDPGEIWYVKLGVNIGFEQDGKREFRRPVLVLKKLGNLFFCIPMTTKGKDNRFYYKISDNSRLIMSQVRVLDKKRFLDKIGRIDDDEFILIKQKLREFLL